MSQICLRHLFFVKSPPKSCFGGLFLSGYFTREYSIKLLFDVFVDHVLQEFLATAFVRFRVAFLEHVSFQGFEVSFTSFDFGTDSFIPGRVTLLDKVRQAVVCAHCGCDLETACEGVHTADVGEEEVFYGDAFATNVRVEVYATGFESTVFEQGVHDAGGFIDDGSNWSD